LMSYSRSIYIIQKHQNQKVILKIIYATNVQTTQFMRQLKDLIKEKKLIFL
jgi:hypothetical protein